MAGYYARVDLENALGRQTIKALFDDDGDSQADEAPIQANIDNASTEVDAVLAGTYSIALPLAIVPSVVKYAALDFGVALAYRRRPDVAEAMNAKSWSDHREAALKKLESFASAFMRLPPSAGTPTNVGSVVVDDSNRIITTGADGQDNGGAF